MLAAVTGFGASFLLTMDKFVLLKAAAAGRTQTFLCDINAFVSCGAVMGSKEASAFGFPNSLLGIAGFFGLFVLASLLSARTAIPRFAIWATWFGCLLGIIFVTWLQYQSIFHLRTLCPYCMGVWAVMIPTFVIVSGWALGEFRPRSTFTRLVRDWSLLIVLLWYVAVGATVLFRFGSSLWA